MDTSVVTVAVGLYVGITLSQFFTAIIRDLVTPFLVALFPGVQSTVDKFIVQLGPIKLSIGDAIASTINLLVAWFVVSMTLPYIKSYAPIGGRR
jgi:large-conductance mechanosensitive channel